MIRMAAGHTRELALGLAIIFADVSALVTHLTCVLGVYFYDLPEFVVAVLIESPPC